MEAHLVDNGTIQRSDEWKQARLGKFTASEIVKLLGVKGLGETGKNYAFDKAVEQLYGEMEESFISYDMQRGIDLEPLAFAKFKEIKELEFIEVKECSSFNFNENAIATPDGLVGEDAILEIKCPRSNTFFKLVATNEIDSKYYAQMQMQMLATNRNRAHFFNYLVHEGTEYYHEIIVERDESMIEKIKERLKEAIEIKIDYINKLNNNKQW